MKSGKPSGGQKGHPGTTLTMAAKADTIVRHSVTRCVSCHQDLKHISVTQTRRRQVFDIPEVHLEVTEDIINAQIQRSPVVNVDETGMYCVAHRDWVHVASTEHLTYYAIHFNCGRKAINSIGILNEFTEWLIHDCLGGIFFVSVETCDL